MHQFRKQFNSAWSPKPSGITTTISACICFAPKKTFPIQCLCRQIHLTGNPRRLQNGSLFWPAACSASRWASHTMSPHSRCSTKNMAHGNISRLLLENKTPFVATEKIDGQSGTFALVKRKRFLLPDTYEYMVCSRNLRLFKKDNSSYWSVSERYGIEDVLKKLIGKHDWVCIQGRVHRPQRTGQ